MAMTVLHNATIYTGIAKLPESSLVMEDDRVVDVISKSRFQKRTWAPGTVIIELDGLNIAPGFIDTHIHGLHGYGTEDNTVESMVGMSEALLQYGVTAFCPTLYPTEEERMLSVVKACATAKGVVDGAQILGSHLEGPFISAERLGVQRPETVRTVDLEFMKRIYDAAQGTVAIMTVAPEIKNMRELALYCNHFGTVLSAGHTNADYENMIEGMQAGILHSTHCFNAMRGLHHRNPGTVGAILLYSNLSTEIIADGFHVHPALITLLLRCKPVDRVVLVTDALKPTGQSEGILIANGEEVYLSDQGIFQRKADDCIAGSSLTMNKGIKNLVGFGVPAEAAIQMASSNPADLLDQDRKRGYLLPDSRADIAVFDDDYQVQMTWVGGKLRFNRYRHQVRDPELESYGDADCACAKQRQAAKEKA
jgi:N-acetylglucosamine-6-phosphate deacetylase